MLLKEDGGGGRSKRGWGWLRLEQGVGIDEVRTGLGGGWAVGVRSLGIGRDRSKGDGVLGRWVGRGRSERDTDDEG